MVEVLADPLPMAIGRLNVVEGEAKDLKNTLHIMQKAMDEMKSGDNLPAASRSGMGIYMSGLDNLKKAMRGLLGCITSLRE